VTDRFTATWQPAVWSWAPVSSDCEIRQLYHDHAGVCNDASWSVTRGSWEWWRRVFGGFPRRCFTMFRRGARVCAGSSLHYGGSDTCLSPSARGSNNHSETDRGSSASNGRKAASRAAVGSSSRLNRLPGTRVEPCSCIEEVMRGQRPVSGHCCPSELEDSAAESPRRLRKTGRKEVWFRDRGCSSSKSWWVLSCYTCMDHKSENTCVTHLWKARRGDLHI